jgi:hypothetical protein
MIATSAAKTGANVGDAIADLSKERQKSPWPLTKFCIAPHHEITASDMLLPNSKALNINIPPQTTWPCHQRTSIIIKLTG